MKGLSKATRKEEEGSQGQPWMGGRFVPPSALAGQMDGV